jgi:hypothetical protein
MFQLPEIPLGKIETLVASAVVVAWGSVSAVQLIKTKLQQQKCLICNRAVGHRDQARDVPVSCHERCYYLAKLIVKDLQGRMTLRGLGEA